MQFEQTDSLWCLKPIHASKSRLNTHGVIFHFLKITNSKLLKFKSFKADL